MRRVTVIYLINSKIPSQDLQHATQDDGSLILVHQILSSLLNFDTILIDRYVISSQNQLAMR